MTFFDSSPSVKSISAPWAMATRIGSPGARFGSARVGSSRSCRRRSGQGWKRAFGSTNGSSSRSAWTCSPARRRASTQSGVAASWLPGQQQDGDGGERARARRAARWSESSPTALSSKHVSRDDDRVDVPLLGDPGRAAAPPRSAGSAPPHRRRPRRTRASARAASPPCGGSAAASASTKGLSTPPPPLRARPRPLARRSASSPRARAPENPCADAASCARRRSPSGRKRAGARHGTSRGRACP